MAKVRVVWDEKALSGTLLNDEGIGKALLAHGMKLAARNSELALRRHHKPLPDSPLYACELRKLEHTQAAIVHSTNKVAAAIGRKHGYPKRYKV